MPSRIHWSGKNNRSQHNLVGPTGAEDSTSVPATSAAAASPSSAGVGATSNPPSASPNTAFSSRESFQPDPSTDPGNHAQQPPPPPSHPLNIYANAAGGVNPASIPPQLQHSTSVSGVFDSRQREQQDFADQVTRSQSYRYTHPSPTSTQQLLVQQQQQQQQQEQPQQQHHHHHHPHPQQIHPPPSSTSLEDVSSVGDPNISSPLLGAPQRVYVQQQPQPPQPPIPKSKQSTRRLIKNILNPRGQDFAPQSQNSQHGSVSGPARRNSKRVSLPPPYPPALRTGASQLSLDQQRQLDWQSQGPPTQPSPLQGSSQDTQNPTIRTVPSSDAETPYPAEDPGYREHRGQALPHGQGTSELQHQQYGQTPFDTGAQQQQQQQQPQQYQFPNSQQQAQYQAGNPQTFSGHLANPRQQNPETVSQLSHESPVTDPDQRSATNIPPQVVQSPAITYQTQIHDIPGQQNPPPAAQASAPPPQQQSMAPPSGGPPPGRRSQDAEKMRDQVQPPPGPPPSYRQSQQPNMNPLPQPPNAGPPNPNFRASNVLDRQQFEGQGEAVQGRNSPQPPPVEREDPEKAFKDLLTKYKNVKRLYFDGKKEIEQLNGQVEQLQNAIANQRMSQSRTSLDDSEYTTRFNRLNGAINNLSFNIRKDWVTLPAWLVPFVSGDALKTGKQEMTAVGRAVITRWIVDEIFNRCFHPGLDPELSRQLKIIELNIRHFSYTMNSQEEYDALTSKVVSWRMATLEGLQDVLRSSESTNHRNDFIRRATSNLTACLFQHLADPPPAGVDGSASMIVELAVGIAGNLPLESRDVAIVYPLPEQPIQPELMDVEKTGLPALETRGSDLSEEAVADDGSGGGPGAAGAGGGKEGPKDGSAGKERRGEKRTAPPPPKDAGKVRFAGFVAVEVRGRQVLVKAPVWSLG